MKKIGFIGGGNMAEALVHGLIAKKVFKPADIIVADVAPERRRKLARQYKIAATASNLDVLREAATIVLAVKPQQIDAVLHELAAGDAKPKAKASKLFISIVAGVPIARMAAALGVSSRIVRVMPNAPAMVGLGMAALARSKGASRADEALALKIFNAVGDALVVKDEKLLDAVTALSGSGPAYVYLFAKSLADAAINEGIPVELALRMTLQTIRGAEQVMRTSKQTLTELIRVVASPGGTTEAALRRFVETGFSDIVAGALHAAAARSRELGRGQH
ncbi:MAG TPA: pyrroline-5-carboxylate reductase [Candidatus Binataceae bacterium]|nr:pyrroline-5-carboxylate reductase [Candidatus Binataceae bacterium]